MEGTINTNITKEFQLYSEAGSPTISVISKEGKVLKECEAYRLNQGCSQSGFQNIYSYFSQNNQGNYVLIDR